MDEVQERLMAVANGRERDKSSGGCVECERDDLLKGLVGRLCRGADARGKDGSGQSGPYPDGTIDVPGLDVPEREE